MELEEASLRCCDCDSGRLYARGRCAPCYMRHMRALKKAGTYTPLRLEGTTRERLLAHVTPGWGACILRTTGLDRDGYSLIREADGPTRRAHRVAYEELVGPIPADMHLDHLCHTRDLGCPGGPACLHRRCINPAHLEPVTARENMLRGEPSRKTSCANGHPFTGDNVRVDGRGRRACRACQREAARRYRARRAA